LKIVALVSSEQRSGFELQAGAGLGAERILKLASCKLL
jgi:hypothetical protein